MHAMAELFGNLSFYSQGFLKELRLSLGPRSEWKEGPG